MGADKRIGVTSSVDTVMSGDSRGGSDSDGGEVDDDSNCVMRNWSPAAIRNYIQVQNRLNASSQLLNRT